MPTFDSLTADYHAAAAAHVEYTLGQLRRGTLEQMSGEISVMRADIDHTLPRSDDRRMIRDNIKLYSATLRACRKSLELDATQASIVEEMMEAVADIVDLTDY